VKRSHLAAGTLLESGRMANFRSPNRANQRTCCACLPRVAIRGAGLVLSSFFR
jgi:hypothetical protein